MKPVLIILTYWVCTMIMVYYALLSQDVDTLRVAGLLSIPFALMLVGMGVGSYLKTVTNGK